MRGLDLRIHVFFPHSQGVDGRDKPGHDDKMSMRFLLISTEQTDCRRLITPSIPPSFRAFCRAPGSVRATVPML
jgi:hypothetical protein